MCAKVRAVRLGLALLKSLRKKLKVRYCLEE